MKKIGRDPKEETEYVVERVRNEDKNQSQVSSGTEDGIKEIDRK